MTSKKVAMVVKPLPERHSLSADAWVEDRKHGIASTKRLTLDIPAELHAKIKAFCALRGVKMVDEIKIILEQKFGKSL